jgi:hypothetical protein
MEWIPAQGMWLSYLQLDALAGDLDYDIAVDVDGKAPSPVDAGIDVPPVPAPPAAPAAPATPDRLPVWMLAGAAILVIGFGAALGKGLSRRAPA